MRFIIHELPYERPLLAGRLRYERDGVPTGAVESWRITNAVDGYRFLRVDLDAREAESGRSCLYHVTLNPAGSPEQLKFRLWGNGPEVAGTAVWEGGEILSARQVDGVAYQDIARGWSFWFPAGMGLTLLSTSVGETKGVTMMANTTEPSDLMKLTEVQVTIELGEATMEDVAGELLPVRPLHLAWNDQWRTVWIDPERRPVRLSRNDGLTAVAERLVRYG